MGIFRSTVLCILLLASVTVQAQSDVHRDKYNEFHEKISSKFNAQKEKNIEQYRAFRAEANSRYADFVKKAWALYKSEPAVPVPYEEPVVPPEPIVEPVVEPTVPAKPVVEPVVEPTVPAEPVVEPVVEPTVPAKPVVEPVVEPTVPAEPVVEPVVSPQPKPEPKPEPKPQPKPEPKPQPKPEPKPEPNPLPYDVVIAPPVPIEQPKPIVPIHEVPQPVETWFNFTFYGTDCKVRLDDRHKFKLSSTDENSIARQWSACSGEDFDNLLRDCLALRSSMNLCDFAYLQMLEALATQYFGKDTNEAVFLMSYLYCQSGYKMRFGRNEFDHLVMLFSSQHLIFGHRFFTVDGDKYYPYNFSDNRCYISSASFDKEQSLSLVLDRTPQFENCATDARSIKSQRYPDVAMSAAVNKNLIDFYNTYPISQYSNNVMTQWAIYANTPVSNVVARTLYKPLKDKIAGLSQVDAVSRLLNWVQTGFEYKVDKDAWGKERIFFADETLYYPYCDCEDRSILFTRLVRDLLGLDAILVYYPGHIAAAIGFTESVEGDYFNFEGKRYVVCDPTYIGASVGMTMPQMNNSTAKLIKLN